MEPTGPKPIDRDYKRTMLIKIKHRAKRCGIKFDLTPEDIHIPNYCPILGIPILAGRYGGAMSSPSIDRLDPSKGYTKGNVIVVSNQANTMRSCGTPEQCRDVAKFYGREAPE